MNRIGVMTVAKNEEATIAFTIGAALPHVDHYVYVDTGSDDMSLRLVYTLFDRQIKAGQLSVRHVDIGPDIEIWRARELALSTLKQNDIDFFLVLDGDDVCYRDKITNFCGFLSTMDVEEVNNIWAPSHELYQWQASTTAHWITGILEGYGQFYEMTKFNGAPHTYARPTRAQNLHDAFATGQWTDESRGKTPEGIFHSVARGDARYGAKLSAHYGWARPNAEQERKAILRWGDRPNWNPRVNQLHLEPHRSSRGLESFTHHPEIFQEIGNRVMDLIV